MWRRVALIATTAALAGCFQQRGEPQVGESENASRVTDHGTSPTPERLAVKHLPNVVKIHDKVISGGAPEGDAAFHELRALGVRTIVSVDGARPDVKTAALFGLKYVHLPHGYDGISDQRAMELAKAVRDLDGPIYIHCHHGKHRSPVAASVACVTAGLIPPSQSRAVLELAGTSSNYRGLFHSVEKAQPVEKALLDALNLEFRESVEVPPMAESMVTMERTHDRILQIADAGWRTPADHPDLEPAHEALLLREHFTELLRADHVRQEPLEFRALLRDSENAARELEDGLRNWKPESEQSPPPASLQQAAGRITANCQACHQKFRDVPLRSAANPSRENAAGRGPRRRYKGLWRCVRDGVRFAATRSHSDPHTTRSAGENQKGSAGGC